MDPRPRARPNIPLARVASLALVSVLAPGVPRSVEAQSVLVLAGRVVDAQSGAGLSNVLVALEGHGAVLSSSLGAFRFAGIRPGEYRFRADALGYRDYSETFAMTADTVLIVALEVLPIELDGFTVELGTLDFDGRVRDPRTDSYVPDAEVRSDQGHEESTNLFGSFDLDDVFDGPPLRLNIRAFSYLPLDTTFVPDDDERYPFDLVPDPIMTRMIHRYMTRLDDRAGDRIYEYQQPLSREDLAQFSANTPLRRLMEAKYPLHILRRIECFIIDEREYRFGSLDERISVLEGTFANDLARIELLEFPGEARLFMVRIYTRRFLQRHVGDPERLGTLSMTPYPGGVFCR